MPFTHHSLYFSPGLPPAPTRAPFQILLMVLFQLLLDAEMTSGGQAVLCSAMLMVANLLLILTIFLDAKVPGDVSC